MTAGTDDERSWMTYGEPPVYPVYPEGYYERAEGSNYRNYGDDEGWPKVLNVLDLFYPDAPKPTLLEVGCAKGHFVKHARDRGYDACGFDISEYAIAKSVAPEHTYVWNAANPLLHADQSFDIVASFETFEHLFEKDVPYTLRELRRVLKPGGRLVAKIGGLDPHDEGDHDATHFTKREKWWWDVKLYEAGLSVMYEDALVRNALDAEFEGRDWHGRFFVASRMAD